MNNLSQERMSDNFIKIILTYIHNTHIQVIHKYVLNYW